MTNNNLFRALDHKLALELEKLDAAKANKVHEADSKFQNELLNLMSEYQMSKESVVLILDAL